MMMKIGWVVLAALIAAPLLGIGAYPLHLMIVALIWAYIYTSWAIIKDSVSIIIFTCRNVIQ